MFSELLSVDDQLKALERIRDYLDEGGKFIFDVFLPDHKYLINDVKNRLEFDGEYEPGKRLQRFCDKRYDNINQIVNITLRFVWDENSEQKMAESYFPFRYYFRYELENLIARTGLKLGKIYGGFDRSELDNESKDFVVVCYKA